MSKLYKCMGYFMKVAKLSPNSQVASKLISSNEPNPNEPYFIVSYRIVLIPASAESTVS